MAAKGEVCITEGLPVNHPLIMSLPDKSHRKRSPMIPFVTYMYKQAFVNGANESQ